MSTERQPETSGGVPAWQSLTVDHLQLPGRISAALYAAGITTLGSACETAEGSLAGHAPFAPELCQAVAQLREAQVGDTIDWKSYWGLRGSDFHHLAAAPSVFGILPQVAGDAEVSRATLGNAGAMLQAAGFATLAEVIHGLEHGISSVRGLGRTKLNQLFLRLLQLSDEASGGEWPASLDAAARTGDRSTGSVPDRPVLSPGARMLPISVLQLGAKSRLLQQAGLRTVGDVADADFRALRGLQSVGNRTISLVAERLQALSKASAEDAVDWSRFSETAGLPLLPSSPVASGAELLALLPSLLDDLAAHLRDDVYRDILANRLTKSPHEQATLDEIGYRARPRVTRERIRQKQVKLLNQLTGALLWDRDGKLGIHFHPEFVAWWRRAAAEFEGLDEIGFDEFVGRLAAAWDVPVHLLTPQLPFIVAIVTGEPQMPTALRAGARISPRLQQLAPGAGDTSLMRFRLGKAARQVAERGVVSLSDLVRAATRGTVNRSTEAMLSKIADAVDDTGMIDWARYAAMLELEALPGTPPSSAESFCRTFPEVIADLLARIRVSGRASRIFALRTGHPAKGRMTLAAVAEHLGIRGPTVKREETEFLEDLHDILVDREFARLPVWLDADWLRFCSEAYCVFGMYRADYERFVRALAVRWRMTPHAVETSAAGLWAIFTGYPEGRSRRTYTLQVEEPAPVEQPMRIQLRGFRRLH